MDALLAELNSANSFMTQVELVEEAASARLDADWGLSDVAKHAEGRRRAEADAAPAAAPAPAAAAAGRSGKKEAAGWGNLPTKVPSPSAGLRATPTAEGANPVEVTSRCIAQC